MRFLNIMLCGMILSAVSTLPVEAQTVDYALWAKTLQQYVDENGLVDYQNLKKNRVEFDTFIDQVEQADISAMTDVEAKAFWINAYNAITLKVVLDAYPVGGIRRINFGLVWNLSRDVAQTKKSLGDIEHKILRPLGDPRIHFAINCASIGCPELPNVPFYPETLNEQLDKETIEFINNPSKVRLDQEAQVLYYSAIFDWFEEDFLLEHVSIRDYISDYIREDDKNFLKNNTVKTKVLKYDWGLNEQN